MIRRCDIQQGKIRASDLLLSILITTALIFVVVVALFFFFLIVVVVVDIRIMKITSNVLSTFYYHE
jgi:hypothetical protein